GSLGAFTEWEAAHYCAHAAVQVPGHDLLLPLVVWDLRPDQGRRVLEVDEAGCRTSTWETLLTPGSCDHTTVLDDVSGAGSRGPVGQPLASRRELALRSVDVGWRAARLGLEVLLSNVVEFETALPGDDVSRLALTRQVRRVLTDLDAIRWTVRNGAARGGAESGARRPRQVDG
nr:hypothetical protein [Micromonospora sp. DSM 115978]